MTAPDDLMSVRDFARRIGTTQRQVREWVRERGRFPQPCLRDERNRPRWRREIVEAFCAEVERRTREREGS
jgi:hypothetical protein